MRRVLSLALSLLLFVVPMSLTVSAAEPDKHFISTTTEYLENGDYVITTLYESAVQPRAGTSGSKTSTRYSSSGQKIFSVTVTGTFTYVYGSSVDATGASASVAIYHPDAQFVSKNAYTQLHTAVGEGTVNYRGDIATLTVTLSCDVYGGLH